MGVFDDDIATALELIEENGQLVKWRQLSNNDTDDETDKPWKTDTEAVTPPTDFDVHICFLPIDRVGAQSLRYLAGTEVAVGSMYGLMGAVDFEPSIKDVVIRDGKELAISSIDLLSPNGQKILYTVVFE